MVNVLEIFKFSPSATLSKKNNASTLFGAATSSNITDVRTSTTDSRQYSSQTTDSRVYAPSYIITTNSPNATVTKKDAVSSTPSVSNIPSISTPTNLSGGSSQAIEPPQAASLFGGVNIGTVGLIGGVALGGILLYSVLKKNGSKK